MTSIPVVLTVGVSAVMAARLRRANTGTGAYSVIETVTVTEGLAILRAIQPKVVMVNTGLEKGGALSLSDYVAYRYPDTRVIFEMGATRGFSDGSLFAHAMNAHAMVTPGMLAEDVDAVVSHHAQQQMSA